MIQIKSFEVNNFGELTYVVWDTSTRDAMIIDPGMSNAHERLAIDDYIARNDLHPVHLVNTHLHIDHIMGNDYITSAYGIGTEAHPADEFLSLNRDAQGRMFGMKTQAGPLKIERPLAPGDVIHVGEASFTVLHVPGHSPGSIALYDAADGVVFTGDALFQGSIGRTDLPGGDYAQLISSIRGKLLTLPGETVVYPGHGPSTTIGREQEQNPYL